MMKSLSAYPQILSELSFISLRNHFMLLIVKSSEDPDPLSYLAEAKAGA